MKRSWSLPLVLCVLALAACSGGGTSSSSGAQTRAQPTAKTATVGVLLTDAPATQWDQAFATITSIELLGDNQRVSLFEGRETVDLLSLPDYYELFSIADGVPPGTFTKIRLQLEQLELVELDDMGVEVRRVQTQLVGHGKMDVSPRRSFAIAGGDTLLIEIDFDMNKSFKTTETGNGKLIVRPVVFATVHTDGLTKRLARVTGVVDSISADDQSLVLCQTMLTANRQHGDDDEDDEDDYDHCVLVATDEATGVFNAEGLPVTFADVLVDDSLTAVGFLRHVDHSEEGDDEDQESKDDNDRDDDGDHHYEDDFLLDAVALELGDNFARYMGTVETNVLGDQFEFSLDPGQGYEADPSITTQLAASTRVFSKAGEELDLLAIAPDVRAIVDGVIATGTEGTEDDVLRAALIVLDMDAGQAEEVLRGKVTSVNIDESRLQLLVGTEDRCVDVSGADIFLISDDDGSLVSERGELGDVLAGSRADAYGAEGTDGCFVATDVLVENSGA